MPPRLPVLEANERVREIAFAFLFNDSHPVSPEELSAAAGGSDIGTILDALSEAGWIDRSEDGQSRRTDREHRAAGAPGEL